jgi:hypothetical protein
MTANTEPQPTAPLPRPRTTKPNVLARLDTRRRLIATLIAERGGRLPTVRAVQALLKQAGRSVSLGTVHTDLKFLGLLGG